MPAEFDLNQQCALVPPDAQLWMGISAAETDARAVIFPTSAFSHALQAFWGRPLPDLDAPFIVSWGAQGAQRACRTFEEARTQLRLFHGAAIVVPVEFAPVEPPSCPTSGTTPDHPRNANGDKGFSRPRSGR